MTKEEIIEMAKQSGWDEHHAKFDLRIEKFAELVAEKEREAFTAHAMTSSEKAIDVAIKLEREACAKICEEPWQGSPKGIAEQIRARSGNQK